MQGVNIYVAFLVCAKRPRHFDAGDMCELASMPADLHHFVQAINHLFVNNEHRRATTEAQSCFRRRPCKNDWWTWQDYHGNGPAMLVENGRVGASVDPVHGL